MRTIINFIVAISLIFITQSCSNDDDCIPLTIDITSLEVEYGCINTPYQMDINISEDFIIIRSQTIFDDLVTGTCTPQIDFEAFDLLIGKKALTNGFDTIDYDGLEKNCDNNQLSLSISFILNDTAEAPNVTYHVLVPKLPENELITVSLVTIN
ncbi:hypothetical protein [Psychroserpens burtonensis]|uniref:hypothetical protein n=1 Tax=Psychroserpens burtonensis TaxID=49278 RepID=UPI0003F55FEF|nr:hypothetical protein [Psychroserpens burtonensis]